MSKVDRDVPFSKMTGDQKKELLKKACSGLPRKFLNEEDLKHRKQLDRALALDEKKRADAHKLFLDMKYR